MIRVELSITSARLIIAHVLLASLTSFLARAQLHLARSLGAEKHRFPILADGLYALHIRSREPPRCPLSAQPIAIAYLDFFTKPRVAISPNSQGRVY